MLNYIEKLQKKPEKERRKILHVTVLCIMLVIVGAWFMSFSTRFRSAPEAPSSTSFFSPFENVAVSFKATREGATRQFGEIKSLFSSWLEDLGTVEYRP